MLDYYPFIARAVSRLAKNTPQARQDLFAQVRAILPDQLRKRQPPASDSAIMRERAALEEAIRKVESEIAMANRSTLQVGSTDPAVKSTEEKSRRHVFEQAAVQSGPPRGRMTISEGQRPVIEFGEAADTSTFINLSAHAWLEELMRDAAHPQAPDSLRQDARTVLKWLGVVRSDAIQTKHHDQFARAFERYVMEGHAPSGAIAPALATLSESLAKIYGTPDSLNIPLNEEIRGVFDRMFAMPDQIANWTADRKRASIAPMESAHRDVAQPQKSNVATEDNVEFDAATERRIREAVEVQRRSKSILPKQPTQVSNPSTSSGAGIPNAADQGELFPPGAVTSGARAAKGPSSRAGYIYILKPRVSIDGQEVVKIGMTTRTVAERVRELTTGSMVSLEVVYSLHVENARSFERYLHSRYRDRRLIAGGGQEFFSVPAQEVVAEIECKATEISRARARAARNGEMAAFLVHLGAARVESRISRRLGWLWFACWLIGTFGVNRIVHSIVGYDAPLWPTVLTALFVLPTILSIAYDRLKRHFMAFYYEPRFRPAIDAKHQELQVKYPLAYA